MEGEKEPLNTNKSDEISYFDAIFEVEDLSITVSKGVKIESLAYCQIHIYKLPNQTESFESFEKCKISTAQLTQTEITWKPAEQTKLKMKSESAPNQEQYQIRIELFCKNGTRKELGLFHLGMDDVADEIPKKGKTRNFKSPNSKKVSTVDIKYKIYKEDIASISPIKTDLPTVVLDSTAGAPAKEPSIASNNDQPDIDSSTDRHDSVTNSPSLPFTDEEKKQNHQSPFRSSLRNLNIRKSLNFSRSSIYSSSKRHSRKLSTDLPPDILESTLEYPAFSALSFVASSASSPPPATESRMESCPSATAGASLRCSPPPAPSIPIQLTGDSSPASLRDEHTHDCPRPKWKPKSCIIVIGTTGRGKTTTVNIYTGQCGAVGGASHSTTKLTRMYRDILPEHQVAQDQVMYPAWLDTVGLDESEAEINNGELLKSYLECLQKKGMSWVHAIIWNITPEEKQIQMLADQAKFIKEILGPTKENVWKNVIIIVKGKCNDKDFQGALSAVAAIERGHRGIVESIQRLQYTVDVNDDAQVKMARNKINSALANITEPLQVMFTNKICLDCGQEGDERLLSDMCHEVVEKIPTTLLKFKIKKKVCSHCKKKWTRKQFGQWKYTQGSPCVRIRNQRDIGEGETMATNKKCHSMVDVPSTRDYWCSQPQTIQ